MTIVNMVAIGVGFIIIEAIVLGLVVCMDLSILNPVRNYKNWSLNWFGTIITTLILNIIFFPYAFGYWAIYKLFTVGRK